VRTPSRKQDIINLSGGNQQKVILGRWLSEQGVKVLLIDEPTRGIDVGAKSEIYEILYELAAQGMAIIVISSELPEIMGITDRIIVMCEGRIAARSSDRFRRAADPGRRPPRRFECRRPSHSTGTEPMTSLKKLLLGEQGLVVIFRSRLRDRLADGSQLS
jgi:ABC-type multidrug transport system ATPase subunit